MYRGEGGCLRLEIATSGFFTIRDDKVFIHRENNEEYFRAR